MSKGVDPDDIELNKLGEATGGGGGGDNEVGVGETGFGGGRTRLLEDPHEDGDVHDQSIAIVSGFGEPGITQLEDEEEEEILVDYEERMGRTVTTKTRKALAYAKNVLEAKEDMIRGEFGFRPIRLGLKRESTDRLLRNMKLRVGVKGRYIGATYRGVDVLVWGSSLGRPTMTGATSRTFVKLMSTDFRKLVVEAKEEYVEYLEESTEKRIRELVDPPHHHTSRPRRRRRHCESWAVRGR